MIKIEMPEVYLIIKSKKELYSYEVYLRNKGGIYFLYDKQGVLIYVGKSGDLFERLLSHFQGRSNFSADYIYYVEVYLANSHFEREIYETYAINEFNPIFNVQKNYNVIESNREFYADIEDEIKALEEEKELVLDEIENLEINSVSIPEVEQENTEFYELGEILSKNDRIQRIDERIEHLKREKRRMVLN